MKHVEDGSLVAGLRELVRGRVIGPEDESWDAERAAWHLLADQRPVAVVHVADADDIGVAVRFAGQHGVGVSAQPTGHGATPATDGAILLRMGALTGLSVDLAAGTARVEAGARWRDLNQALNGSGMSSLPGSNGDTTVVGYTLGGGLGWFGRKYGQAANLVRSFEIVDADGEPRRVTAESDADLFWALRGGGGDFAIVVAMELALVPAPEIFGGRTMWPIQHAKELLRTFAEVTTTVPDELTLWIWLLNFPDVPFVPEAMRGQWAVALDAVFLGPEDEARKLLAPFEAVAAPLMSGTAMIPLREIGLIAQEPEEPVPGLLKTVLLSDFDAAAIDALLDAAVPGEPSPLFAFEVRHLGGAFARADVSQGAAGTIDPPYLLLAGGFVAAPEMGAAVETALAGLHDKMKPWIRERMVLNFATDEELASLFPSGAVERLAAIKHRVDPHNTIRSNHPVG
ncbi:FAD-binding oxidoreductase [Kribbella sp. NBC_01505]|uniref:FAD-binding oxidoreductase n=1 Tax=Kribbella sp. NBC_01505 TaxID=2903580 RepID=UPI00386F91DF